MVKVILNDKVIAESNDTIKVEGNHYFLISSIDKSFLKDSKLKTTCIWKVEASYTNSFSKCCIITIL